MISERGPSPPIAAGRAGDQSQSRMGASPPHQSMIPKSGYRFSEKIMLKQQAKAK
jgi:hypothetical protein